VRLFEAEEVYSPQADDEAITEKGYQIAGLSTPDDDGLREQTPPRTTKVPGQGRSLFQERLSAAHLRLAGVEDRSRRHPDDFGEIWQQARLPRPPRRGRGTARVVLNALVTSSEVTENRPMRDLLWSTIFRWRIHLREVTVESSQVRHSRERSDSGEGWHPGVRCDPQLRLLRHWPLRPGHFRYDPKNDHCLCPAG
jgi:hypothetical protein